MDDSDTLDAAKRILTGLALMLFPAERPAAGGFSKPLARLTLVGGAAFWLANFAISLTPIAAEYRSALSISYLPMLLEALAGGLIIGFCVSSCLLRFFDTIPSTDPILKSVLVSWIALICVTLLIEAPAKLLTTTSDALRYFLIGALINALRISALGLAIGYGYKQVRDA